MRAKGEDHATYAQGREHWREKIREWLCEKIVFDYFPDHCSLLRRSGVAL